MSTRIKPATHSPPSHAILVIEDYDTQREALCILLAERATMCCGREMDSSAHILSRHPFPPHHHGPYRCR